MRGWSGDQYPSTRIPCSLSSLFLARVSSSWSWEWCWPGLGAPQACAPRPPRLKSPSPRAHPHKLVHPSHPSHHPLTSKLYSMSDKGENGEPGRDGGGGAGGRGPPKIDGMTVREQYIPSLSPGGEGSKGSLF
jgi:hypothetical protein